MREEKNRKNFRTYLSHVRHGVLLPSDSLFVTKTIPILMCDYFRQRGVEVDSLPDKWGLTIDDLVEYCRSQGISIPPSLLRQMLQDARAYAFDEKYANYSYDKDVRGLSDSWKDEVRDLLPPDYEKQQVIVVGIGNGIEAIGLFDTVEQLTIVNIAPRALASARMILPKADAHLNAAEDLSSICSNSQDVYVSLRTYQSAFFDVSRSISEAARVLRQSGTVLISVSNAYLGQDGKLVHGQTVSGGTAVNKSYPFELAREIHQTLASHGFENLGQRVGLTEVFVYGTKAV